MAVLHTSVYFPSDLLEALGEHTGHFWSDPAMEPIIHDAVRAWMKPAPATQPHQEQADRPDAGYQWKQVFLPEGIRLRASFGRKPYFAVVEGAEIKYGEHAVSPSCFANLYGSGNRNAWKAVWLRFPGSEEWLLAEVCRSAKKAAIARLLGNDPEEAPQSPRKGKQPAARPSRPAAAKVPPPRAQEAAHDDGAQRKHGAGRSARRKRRGKKHGNP
jgi:hypothetical protein